MLNIDELCYREHGGGSCTCVFSCSLAGAVYLVKSLSSQWGLYGEATEIKKEKSDKHLFTNIKVRVEARV